MRRWARRGRARRRSVSWIDAITTYDSGTGVSSRLLALTNTGLPANVFGATIGVVLASDLPLAGGEDAVLTRLVGRLGFVEGRVNSGAGLAAFGYQMRVVVAQVSADAAGIFSDNFISSAGMANDKILYMRDTVVSPTAIGAVGAGYENMVGNFERWVDVDVRVKRKITVDMQIILWFQTVFPPGTTGADFRLLGGLRTLLMRPR